MNDDELFRLNSLHRFTKHSKLVLEAHSHCEVPAGCGGAVLQWLNPAQGVPVRVEVQSALLVGASHIDGVRLNSAGTRLHAGPHLLSLTMERSERSRRPLAQPPWVLVNMTRRQASEVEERVPEGCSSADGTWLVTAEEPAEGWQLAAWDDSGWEPLRICTPMPQLDEWEQDWYDRLNGLGCVALAFPNAPKLWLRKRFVLTELSR